MPPCPSRTTFWWSLPIEDSLDLHTFSPKEIRPLVEEYLHQCQQHEIS